MELSRRDFMRNTAAFAAVASVLGTSGIAFAADADQNCLVKVDSPDRAELAKRFKAGRMMGYLSHYQELPLEEIVDEMLSILADRNRIMQKKQLESNNAEWNRFLEEGFGLDEDDE